MSDESDSQHQEEEEEEVQDVGLVKESQDNEYYSFLNVPRDASDQQINVAYKKLSRLYHPDKHRDEEKKKKAEQLFAKLIKAHEVLSDPHKRAIYDCLGKKGLKEQGWQIVQRTKTPREIREEYELLAQARAERILNQRTNPSSRFQVSINATDLFERYQYDEEYDEVIDGTFPHFEVSNISFHQTVDFPMTNTDNLVLSGQVSAANGNGQGSVGCNWRTVMSDKSWRELNLGFGSGPNLGGKYFRRLSERIVVTMSGTMQLSSRGLRPAMNVSLGNQLTPHTVGYLTYTSNWSVTETNDALALTEEESGMSTMVVHNSEKYHLSASIQFGIPHTYLTISATRKFEEPQNKIRGVVKLGSFGAIMEYGVERKITRHSVIGATMVVGIPVGVTLRLKVLRGSQTYIFPIRLADEILPQAVFYGTVVPLLTYYCVKKLILDPYAERKKAIENEKQLAANRTKVLEARKEAEASVDLMKQRFARIQSEEMSKNGLVIIVALYGQLLSETGECRFNRVLDGLNKPVIGCDDSDEQDQSKLETLLTNHKDGLVDVTIPMQCLVEDNSRLTLFEGTKVDLVGFYDPTPTQEEDKQLLVRYLYQGHVHQIIVQDDEAMRLPKTGHRIRQDS